MKTLLFAVAACLLFTAQAMAQEDPYATSAPPAAPAATEAPASADPSATSAPPAAPASTEAAAFGDDPPITGGVFGMGLLSFRFGNVGFGFGGRYQHAIVPGGFLTSVASIRDELMLEGGVEFHTATDSYPYLNRSIDRTWSDLEFTVTALWELWFSESFAAYPRVGFGFGFGLSDYGADFAFLGIGGAGILYKLGSLCLRAEITNLALGAGVGFVF